MRNFLIIKYFLKSFDILLYNLFESINERKMVNFKIMLAYLKLSAAKDSK